MNLRSQWSMRTGKGVNGSSIRWLLGERGRGRPPDFFRKARRVPPKRRREISSEQNQREVDCLGWSRKLEKNLIPIHFLGLRCVGDSIPSGTRLESEGKHLTAFRTSCTVYSNLESFLT